MLPDRAGAVQVITLLPPAVSSATNAIVSHAVACAGTVHVTRLFDVRDSTAGMLTDACGMNGGNVAVSCVAGPAGPPCMLSSVAVLPWNGRALVVSAV